MVFFASNLSTKEINQNANIVLNCPESVDYSDYNFKSKDWDKHFDSIETYACSLEDAWQKEVINDNRFFLNALLLKNKDEAIGLYLLKHAHSLSLDSGKRGSSFRSSAESYADDTSDFYNPQRAREYFYRFYADHFFIRGADPQDCRNTVNAIRTSIPDNPINQKVRDRFLEFCAYDSHQLYDLAQAFEKGRKPHFKDKFIAYSLYRRTEVMLYDLEYSTERADLRQKITTRIEKLLK